MSKIYKQMVLSGLTGLFSAGLYVNMRYTILFTNGIEPVLDWWQHVFMVIFAAAAAVSLLVFVVGLVRIWKQSRGRGRKETAKAAGWSAAGLAGVLLAVFLFCLSCITTGGYAYEALVVDKGGDSGGYYFVYQDLSPAGIQEERKVYCEFGTYEIIKENTRYYALHYTGQRFTGKYFYRYMVPTPDDI